MNFGTGAPVWDVERCLVLVFRFEIGGLRWCGHHDASTHWSALPDDWEATNIVNLRLLGSEDIATPIFPAKLHEVRGYCNNTDDLLVLSGELKRKWALLRPDVVDWDVTAPQTLTAGDGTVSESNGQTVQRWTATDASYGTRLALWVQPNAGTSATLAVSVLLRTGLVCPAVEDAVAFPFVGLDRPPTSANVLAGTTWAIVYSTPFPPENIYEPMRCAECLWRMALVPRRPSIGIRVRDRSRGTHRARRNRCE